MILPLGISVKSIANPLTHEVIGLLSKSLFRTFETTPEIFAGAEADALKTAFSRMVRSSGRASPTFHASYGSQHDLSAPDESTRIGAVASLQADFHEAKRFDAELVVVHASFEPIAPESRTAHLAQLRQSLHELEGGLKKSGLRLAVELLPRTCIGNTAEELLAILEGFDETFGVCLDVNHMMDRADDLPRTVRALGRRLLSLHISDYGGVDEDHALPGTGVVPWESLLAALAAIGYRGVFNYEVCLPGLSPAERIAAVERNYTTFIRPRVRFQHSDEDGVCAFPR